MTSLESLQHENAILKARIALLESQLPASAAMTVAQSAQSAHSAQSAERVDSRHAPQQLMDHAAVVDGVDSRRTQQALRENGAWLRLGYEVAEMGTWRREIAADAIHVDARAQRHFDFEGKLAHTDELFARIHPDNRDRARDNIERSLDPHFEGRTSSELHLIYRDGTEHWLQIDAQVLFEGEGETRNPVIAVGTTREITERKQTDAALKNSEQRYRGLVESIDSVVVLVDTQGRFLYINGQTEKYVALASDHIIGYTIFDVFSAAEAQQGMAYLRETIVQNAPSVREWRFYLNKQIFWFRISVQPIRDDHGVIQSLLLTATDITHLKKTEEALRGRIDFERMLAELSTRFISLPFSQADIEMHNALGRIASFAGMDHAAVFRFDEVEGKAVRLYEWSVKTDGLVTKEDYSILLADVANQLDYIRKNEVLYMPDVSVLPQDGIIKHLVSRHVQSVVVLPLYAQGHLFGGITLTTVFPTKRLNEDQLASLKLAAEIIANAFERWRIEDEIRENNLLLEKRVQERTAEIRDLYNNAPCGYHALDTEGKFVHVNDTELHWLGYSREEMLGRSFAEFVTPGGVKKFEQCFPLLRTQGFVRDAEFDMLRRDGTILPVLINATTVNDAQGNMTMSRSTLIDMTERKRAEQALRDSDNRLNYLLAETPAMIFTLGGDQLENMRVTYCSPSSKKMLGLEPHELMRDYAFYAQTLSVIEIDKFASALQTLFEKREAVVEIPFSTSAGEKRYFSVGMRLLTFEPGKHIEIIGYAVDMTAQVAVENALRASEARWRSTVQHAPALIGVVDKHGIVTSLNRPILDQPIGQLIGRPLQELFPATNQPLVTQAMNEMFASGVSSRHTFVYADAAGDFHHLHCYFGPIQNGNETDAAVVIVLDITDLKRTEAELQTQRDFARQVMDAIGQGLVVSDNNNRIEYINPFLERLLGHTLEEVVGVSVNKFVTTDQFSLLDIQHQLRIHGETTRYEIPIIAGDGKPRLMLVTAAPRWRNGEVTGVIAIMTDMTEAKEMEARLRESRDTLSAANFALERAARMKDEFLASMSHELRTPLTAILGLSEGLTEQVLGPLNPKQLEAVSTIESSGRHLLNLINEILDLSKIEAGVMDLIITQVPVTSICNSSLLFVREMATKKRIKTFLTIDSSVEFVAADERRLKQMLVNLLSNAVKFTPADGRVGLEVSGDAETGVAHFTVWDTGIGIDHKDIDRLFQPFVQLSSTLSRHYTGTGLGLSLVARMAELHGGSVTVESEINHGSRFTISLPWSEEGTGTTAMNDPASDENAIYFPFQTTKQVLVVEDAVSDADVLTRYLNEINAKATVLPRGEGVTDYAAATSTDVILLDLMLPDQTGWSVLQQLKANASTASIPVIVVSVLDESSQAINLGATDYLVKPVTRQQLQSVLAKAIKDEVTKPPRVMVISERRDTVAAPKAMPISTMKTDPPLILLAEDNEANIQTVSGYLEAKGYAIMVAHHGGEALDLARRYHPRLILMDVQMPVMDGIEATRQLRRETDPAVSNIPIIALTALAMPGDRQRLLNAGANDYLPKPVSLKNLIATIERILSIERG